MASHSPVDFQVLLVNKQQQWQGIAPLGGPGGLGLLLGHLVRSPGGKFRPELTR